VWELNNTSMGLTPYTEEVPMTLPTEEDRTAARVRVKESIENYTRLIEDHRRVGNEGIVTCLSKVRGELQRIYDTCGEENL
jgi:hypothetical protein